MLRIPKWMGIGLAVLVLAALIPVVFTETVCTAPVETQAEPFKSILEPADQRAEVNTIRTTGIRGATPLMIRMPIAGIPAILMKQAMSRGRRRSDSTTAGRPRQARTWRTVMVCTTWRAMFGNGATTGMLQTTTASVRMTTQPAQPAGPDVFVAGAHGTAANVSYAVRTAAASTPVTGSLAAGSVWP